MAFSQTSTATTTTKLETIDVSVSFKTWPYAHHLSLRKEPIVPSFPNIFDILDDLGDELEYTTEELDRYFDMSHLYDASVDDDDDDDHEEILTDGSDSDTDEQVLSQKLSQLSTQDSSDYESSTTTTTTAGNKRRATTTSESMIASKRSKRDPVPDYLSSDNATFQRAMKTRTGATNIDALRPLAIFTHHLAALRIQKQISMAYLQSGTGQWSDGEFDVEPIDRRVWPSQVISVLSAQRSIIVVNGEIISDEQHLACEQLVRQLLHDLNEQLLYYQRLLDEFDDVTPTLRQAINDFVEQFGIAPLRMKRDLKIALLDYGYRAEIIDRQYRQERPNDYQVAR